MNIPKTQFDIEIDSRVPRISPRRKQNQLDSGQFYYFLGFFSQLGLGIALPIALGALGGSWLDTRFGSKPTAVLAGIGIGFLLSILYLVRTVVEFIRTQDELKKK